MIPLEWSYSAYNTGNWVYSNPVVRPTYQVLIKQKRTGNLPPDGRPTGMGYTIDWMMLKQGFIPRSISDCFWSSDYQVWRVYDVDDLGRFREAVADLMTEYGMFYEVDVSCTIGRPHGVGFCEVVTRTGGAPDARTYRQKWEKEENTILQESVRTGDTVTVELHSLKLETPGDRLDRPKADRGGLLDLDTHDNYTNVTFSLLGRGEQEGDRWREVTDAQDPRAFLIGGVWLDNTRMDDEVRDIDPQRTVQTKVAAGKASVAVKSDNAGSIRLLVSTENTHGRRIVADGGYGGDPYTRCVTGRVVRIEVADQE